jgi:23S rRNA pseudouridine1911/1915/1917 synthase
MPDFTTTSIDNRAEYIEQIFEFKVPRGQRSERVDQYITRMVQNATRNKVQNAIDSGRVSINGIVAKSSKKLKPNDHIVCRIIKPPPMELIPQNIPLSVTYEDDYLMVVNKPAGMVVHPGFGNRYGTLVNAILYHFGNREAIKIDFDDDEVDVEGSDETLETNDDDEELKILYSDQIRPGIVHRIDKDTSGLLLIAKDPFTHSQLAKQFAAHTIEREYLALVWGKFKEDSGAIIGNIGRSSHNRKMFTIVKKDGKYAKTDFFVKEQFEFTSLVQYKLHTGRTHQIRVHSTSQHHPIVGDNLYGGNKIIAGGEIPTLRNKAISLLNVAKRQMLHARTLGFVHPNKNEFMLFSSELPDDFQQAFEIISK